MVEEIHIARRVASLRLKAADNFNITAETCHIGHLVLQAMLDCPTTTHQIDAVTGNSETNLSVANRSMRLASAMSNSGLKVGDNVVNMDHNHLDLCIPFYACHYNGYSQCTIDPRMSAGDLTALFKFIRPRMAFCPKSKVEDIKTALEKNDIEGTHIVAFDDETNNLKTFIEEHKGTEVDFKPALFDQEKTICWLMLTSGTTGIPKAAIIPFQTLLNGLISWWTQFTEKWQTTLALSTIQWMSSLIFFISTPLMNYTRVQTSVPMTPPLFINIINKYRPNVTAWSPFHMAQFMRAAGGLVDLSCFKYIAIGGSAIDKPLLDKFREKCGAYLYLVYGMTELLVPVFDFNRNTPFGSTGKPFQKFQYRLVDNDGKILENANETGELWIKGDAFFKGVRRIVGRTENLSRRVHEEPFPAGYLNNPEETAKLLTEDGWLRTGDMFYRNEQDYFFFVERKGLLFKYTGFWISPLQLEEVIKSHPGVLDACLVGLPDKETEQIPVAVIVKKPDQNVQPQEIFDLVRSAMPDIKQLHGGLFFVDALPETPSGKVHRAKVRDLALTAEKIFPQKQ